LEYKASIQSSWFCKKGVKPQIFPKIAIEFAQISSVLLTAKPIMRLQVIIGSREVQAPIISSSPRLLGMKKMS